MKYENVLITGASSGIGRAFSICLPSSQQVILTGRDSEQLQLTQSSMANCHDRVIKKPVDLLSFAERTQLISELQTLPLSLLVLNAGAGFFGHFIENDLQGELNTIELNISANIHLLRELLPSMLDQARATNRRAQVIVVASHSAYMRVPHFAVYASAKAFLFNFALALSLELKEEPIDILLVCPGATQSRFSERAKLPKKMLSTPCHPQKVAQMSYRFVGKKSILLITRFDKILYWASKFLPVRLFDYVVLTVQGKIIRMKKQYE
jgi:short-subunit dehydrogenase